MAREGTGPQFAVWRLEALAATHSRWLGLQSVPQGWSQMESNGVKVPDRILMDPDGAYFWSALVN